MSTELRRLYRGLGITKSQAEALTWALHLERCLDGAACGTGRTLQLSTMRDLEKAGLVSEDWCVKVDGDGWALEPERYGRCFRLTDAGRAKAGEVLAAEESYMAALAGGTDG